ncbi:MAG: hypothetical protein RL095_32 [Verrucomicrobiota bacterium]|jgi:transcriptional regulatory protein RtcR
MKSRVAFGIFGSMKDSGLGKDRWRKWRPTLALCLNDKLGVQRLELLIEAKQEEQAAALLKDLAKLRPELEINTHVVPIEDPWDLAEVYGVLFDLSRRLAIDAESEELLIHITTGTHVQQICLFLLTESGHLPGLLAQTAPPERYRPNKEPVPEDEDFLPALKGIQIGTCELIDLDLSRYDGLAARFEVEAGDRRSFLKAGIATRSPSFNRMIDEIEVVAERSAAPMLLLGPTGAGKSSLARRVYELRKAQNKLKGDFVEVNCATLRGDTAMSALFGHRKGAFTGAAADREGYLKAADKGILFLDEIGELPLEAQAILLHALEEKRFHPVGSDKTTSSEFQLICGTNRDLLGDVQAGRFRGDLLARLKLWTFELPGLAQRREDLEPNIEHELEKLGRSLGKAAAFNKEAYARYLAFARSKEASWSGNFRDLNASLTRLATLAGGKRISLELVEGEIVRLRRDWGVDQPSVPGLIEAVLDAEAAKAIDLFDRAQLETVLAVCRDSVSMAEAGRKLFAVSRTQKKTSNDSDRLRKYLAAFGLDWERVRASRN